jgi:hypothetical protein
MSENVRRAFRTIAGGGLIATLALCGCGGSGAKSSSTATTTSQSANASATPSLHRANGQTIPTTISLESPALSAHNIPRRYTCEGADIALPLKWGSVPPHTAELVLMLAAGELINGKLGIQTIDWEVAGLNPALHEIHAGKLPAGAVAGRSDLGRVGYSICPPKGASNDYAAVLYAVPKHLGAKSGFDVRALRSSAAAVATAGGTLIGHYKRPAPPPAPEKKVPQLSLSSSISLKPLPAANTCDGQSTSPPLNWVNVPRGTKELALFMVELPIGAKASVAWAVTGLNPALHGIPAGKLPAGAVVGRNSSGQTSYSICPPKGSSKEYALLLYALPHRHPVKAGFNGSADIAKFAQATKAVGITSASYKRG